jgi:hypothetical protein
MLAAGKQQRVDEAFPRHQHFSRALELGIEEAKIEHRVVRDQGRFTDERGQFIPISSKRGLSLRNSAERPWMAIASAGTSRSGLT